MEAVRRLFARLAERRRYRRSLDPLANASDRDLKDLGLTRQDLIRLQAGGRIDRPPVAQDPWASP